MEVLRPNFEKMEGLIVAIAQDRRTKRIRMVGFANEEAYRHSLATGFATFYSRSRSRLWVKGESSGNRLKLVGIPEIDCDGDAIIYWVEPCGPTCHTGELSCFYRNVVEVDKAAFPSPEAALPIMECEVSIQGEKG